jgi:hypothetical protein
MDVTPPSSTASILRLRDQRGGTAGAGFLVDDRHVLTCAYVVNQALEIDDAASPPEAEVQLELPLAPVAVPLLGRVVPDGWFPGTGDGGGNVAVLGLTDPAPQRATPVPLRRRSRMPGRRFRALAFPSGGDGVWTGGIILGSAGPAEWVELRGGIPHQTALALVPGGSPVWDDDAEAVVGMIVAHERTQDADAAYMIPVEVLERYWLPLRTWVRPAVELRPESGPTGPATVGVQAQPPPTPRLDHIPSYTPDDLGTVDRLGITADVHVLASLLASNKVVPPLSIGLFGDWGSGKSFFMRQLERRISVLAAAARAAEATDTASGSYYCAQIVQITFNAWHYVDANLWASLVTRVFEGLDDHLRGLAGSAGDAYLTLLGQLETSRTLLRQAQRRRDVARATLRRAEDRRNRRRRTQDQRTIQDVVRNHPEIAASADELTDALGLDESKTSLREIRAMVRDLRRPAGRLRRGWRALDARGGPWSKARLAAVLAAAVVLAVLAVVWLYPHGERIPAYLSLLVSVVSSAGAVSSALLRNARDALKAAQRVLEAGDPVLAAAQRAVDEEQERVRRYEEELAALERLEPASLYRFISERYTSSDYRQHLGIVAQIQRDFKAMSELLVNRRGDPGTPLPRIDRIVLYIDDLDRCPPDKVVQVLQAVHLLLAFPLFVVVVGVDSRWLLRSLRREYAAVLADPLPAPAATAGDADYWTSTPQSYLEKIFQISYWLRPMEHSGYAELVRNLLAEGGGPGTRPAGDQDPRRPTAGTAAGSGGPDTRQDPAGGHLDADRSSVAPGPTAVPAVDLTPETLVVSDVEQAFIVAMAPFIPTPRAAKRLVNVYRLLRVSLGEERVARLQASGEHQAIILLLGIMIGFPAQAEVVFRALRSTRLPGWPELVERLRPQPWDDEAAQQFDSALAGRMSPGEALPWRRLCTAIDQVHDQVTVTDIGPFAQWAELVGRYSFITGRSLVPG